MCNRSAISQLAVFSVLAVIITLCSSTIFVEQAVSDNSGPVYRISALKSDLNSNTLGVTIEGDSIPAYTVSEKFAPFTVQIDIAGALFDDSVNQSAPLLPESAFASMSVSRLEDQEPHILRLAVKIADTHDYTVVRKGNDIEMMISPATSKIETGQSDTGMTPALTDMKISTSSSQTTILLAATTAIDDYNVETIPGADNRPARMIIDIDDVSISELVKEKNIGTSVDKIRVASRGTGARIVFDSASKDLFRYNVSSVPSGIRVVIDEQSALPVAVKKKIGSSSPKDKKVSDSTLDELIESSSNLMASGATGAAASAGQGDVNSLQDNFGFAGYDKQRISVDFYKIDIHNVFRLFRQITDLNIIVDEDVQGTLTLALTDVPWDFALDIILNLQELEKIERYNTIVVYPKSNSSFVWPERASDNLSFEADVEVVEQEALIIQQSANQPKEIMQAKEIVRTARAAEQKQDYQQAVMMYEKAARLWPTNGKIYNRLATLYLVNLGMNAKAVYFAKEALKVDSSNSNAALYAAIGSANMQRVGEASEFFSQAISADPPMKEALFSYAAFSENNNQNMAALKLIGKYHDNYGETIDTMLAKARILDKIGDTDKATAQYQAILSSGFQIRPDLKKFIRGRVAADNK